MPSRDDFHHNGLIVSAVQYELSTKPLSWLIVWLDCNGNSLHPRGANGGA